MLSDPRPLHRVSGVWAARIGRATGVVPDLERLVGHDRLPEVRTRARSALRLLQRGAGAIRPRRERVEA